MAMTWYGTVIKNDGKTGFVNRKGEYVIRPGDYDVGDLDEINGLLVLKDGKTGKSGIFSVETGQKVIPFRYDGITFAGSDRLVVEKNGNPQLIQYENRVFCIFRIYRHDD